MSSQHNPLSKKRLALIRKRRTRTLIKIWHELNKNAVEGGSCGIDSKRFELHHALLAEVVEHYVGDLQILRARYNIRNKIQLHKIAGLMTASILRYRPVVPRVAEFQTRDEVYANETLAIVHGLSICAEYCTDKAEIAPLLEQPWFRSWFEGFQYLLHHRNYTAESLIFMYETVSRTFYPRNFPQIFSVPRKRHKSPSKLKKNA